MKLSMEQDKNAEFPRHSLALFAALSDVREEFVLESVLPEERQTLFVRHRRHAPRRTRRAERAAAKDHSLGGAPSVSRFVAVACGVAAVGTMLALVQWGRHVFVDPSVGPSGSERDSVTETMPDALLSALVFVSHGDGTCSVKASDSLGADIATLQIPAVSPAGETVTAVADYGFIWSEHLTRVILPDTVTVIGDWAFAECSSLTNVDFSYSLTTVGTAAFVNCRALRNIRLPEGVTILGDSAFSTCTSLGDVALPSTLKVLPKWAFYGCTSLQTVRMSEGLSTIGYCAFYGCKALDAPTFPSTLKTVEDGAFAACTSFAWITLPDSVTTVGSRAFADCPILRFITLPADPEAVREDALEGCTLAAIRYGSMSEWTILADGDFDLEIRDEMDAVP